MELKIEDYLKYYIGCNCDTPSGIGRLNYVADVDGLASVTFGAMGPDIEEVHSLDDIRLFLRPLSDMTEDEMRECGNMDYDFSSEPELNKWTWKSFDCLLTTNQFHYLLSRGFDLWGLIEAGLAINAKAVTQ